MLSVEVRRVSSPRSTLNTRLSTSSSSRGVPLKGDPLRGNPRKGRGLQPELGPGAPPAGVRLFGPRAQGPGAPLGRAVPGPPAQRGLDPGRPEGRRRLDRRRAPPRRPRGHADDQAGDRPAVRRRGRRSRRRPDEDRQVLLRLARGGAGGDLPQDAPGDDLGPPGRPRQARRPPPQHAHAGLPPGVQAPGDRPRDARHLRADRAPARHGEREGRARGPGVPLPRAGGAREAVAGSRPADEGLRDHDRRHPPPHRGAPRGRGHPGRGLRPDEALLLDLAQDEAQRRRGRAALRHPGLPGRRARDPGLLRHPRHGPPALAPRARAGSRTTSRCRSPTSTSRSTRR